MRSCIDTGSALAGVHDGPARWAMVRDRTVGDAAAAVSVAAPATAAATSDGAGGGGHEQSRPGLEPRHLIFDVQQGQVVALVTDEQGQIVRTVPPEELEAMRRERAAHNILLDVRA